MKNNTSIIASLLGGVAIGSALTCLIHHGCKMDRVKRGDIHKKIVDELEQLRNFVASHHPSEELCSCDDPACNCEQK
ncbi:MAG: hypothetical protein SNI51_01930 [Rikenellaceae bacterium]